MIINGLILAAGNSSRLGQAKQTLPYQGQSLLRHIENILSPQVNRLWTVLGYRAEEFSEELKSSALVINPNWSSGMGSSLRSGLAVATQGADALLIALCDQPKIPSTHYNELIILATAHPKKIITSSYNETLGVPAIFPKDFFHQLNKINDQQGAQKIIQDNQEHVRSIPCEQAAFDIDQPHDLRWLI